MKMKTLGPLLVIYLLASTTITFGQKETLDDLVPYHKGKLWGLVHHDMKEFYEPVFDTILTQTETAFYPFVSVFMKSGDQWLAWVVYKGKPMCLTADKKLIPYKEKEAPDERMTIGVVNQEGIKDDGFGFADPNKSSETEFYTTGAMDKVVIKKRGDSSFFYINDVYLPDFTCNRYSDQKYVGSFTPLLFLTKGNKMAIASLSKKRLLTKFEYTSMSDPEGSLVIIVSKEGKEGVINYDGKILVPVDYTKLRWIKKFPGQSNLFIATKAKKYFFAKLNGELFTASTVRYDELFLCFECKDILFIATRSGKKGIVTQDDKETIPVIYDYLEMNDFYNRFFIIRAGKKSGFVDVANNLFTVKPVYDELSVPLKTGFKKNDKDYFLFLVHKGNQVFYADNFGNEFISR